MNSIAYDAREPDFDPEARAGGPDDQPLPRRPRRQFLNRRSAAAAAFVTCAAGFYAGVRVEKGQLSSTSRTFTLPATGAAAAGGRGGATGAGATGAAAGGSSASGSRTAGAAGAAGGAAVAGRFGGGGNASFGTVSSVNGKSLVINEASGNTVKVTLTSVTKISKTQSVSRSAVRPGDTVVIRGVAGKSGSVAAATVTDSGAGLAGAAGGFGGLAGSGSGSGGSGSGSARSGSGSAVGSLFSSGGGGGGG